MLDHESPDAATSGARERQQARRDAVARVAPEIRGVIDGRGAGADAVRVLWETWQVESEAAHVWREMYYALQATLESAAA